MEKQDRKTARETVYNSLKSSLGALWKANVDRVPLRYQLPYAKSLSADYRHQRANAIKMKCVECVNFEDVRKSIQYCNYRKCPLWTSRPYQKAKLGGKKADE